MAESMWKEGLVAEVKRLYEMGWSASQIASELTRFSGVPVSRNAIIGIIHRRGLRGDRPPRPKTNQVIKPRSRKIRRHPFVPRPETDGAITPAAAAVPELKPRHITFGELQFKDCHFPYGDGPYTFCGCPALDNLPYCEPHMRICSDRSMTRAERREASNLRRALETRGFSRPTVAA